MNFAFRAPARSYAPEAEATPYMQREERSLAALRATSVAGILAKLDIALKIAPAPEDERCQWAALFESCRDDVAALIP